MQCFNKMKHICDALIHTLWYYLLLQGISNIIPPHPGDPFRVDQTPDCALAATHKPALFSQSHLMLSWLSLWWYKWLLHLSPIILSFVYALHSNCPAKSWHPTFTGQNLALQPFFHRLFSCQISQLQRSWPLFFFSAVSSPHHLWLLFPMTGLC